MILFQLMLNRMQKRIANAKNKKKPAIPFCSKSWCQSRVCKCIKADQLNVSLVVHLRNVRNTISDLGLGHWKWRFWQWVTVSLQWHWQFREYALFRTQHRQRQWCEKVMWLKLSWKRTNLHACMIDNQERNIKLNCDSDIRQNAKWGARYKLKETWCIQSV